MMAKARCWYDTDRLTSDADMKEIAREIGIQIRPEIGSKKNASILCPNPEHQDRHFGNCFIQQDNTYTCYACGDGGDVFHLVMQYLNVSYPEALGIVADICGGRQYYLMDAGKERDARYVLTQKECRLIGIYNSPVYGIVNLVDDPQDCVDGLRIRFAGWNEDEEATYVIEKCLDPNPLLTIMRQDYSWYREMVLDRVRKAINECDTAIKNMTGLRGGEYFIPTYCEELEEIENLLIKRFPEEEETKKILERRYTCAGKKAMISAALAVKPIVSPF